MIITTAGRLNKPKQSKEYNLTDRIHNKLGKQGKQ